MVGEVPNAARDRSSIRPRWASRPGGGRASRTPGGPEKLSDTVRREFCRLLHALAVERVDRQMFAVGAAEFLEHKRARHGDRPDRELGRVGASVMPRVRHGSEAVDVDRGQLVSPSPERRRAHHASARARRNRWAGRGSRRAVPAQRGAVQSISASGRAGAREGSAPSRSGGERRCRREQIVRSLAAMR